VPTGHPPRRNTEELSSQRMLKKLTDTMLTQAKPTKKELTNSLP